MRRRITRALLTATAAGATITTLGLAVGPAGAVTHRSMAFTPSAPETATDAHGTVCGAAADITGTWTPTDCGKAGYVATGRNFRFAQALVTVPNHPGAVASDPAIYVALDDSTSGSNNFARVGVRPCLLDTDTTPDCDASGSGSTSGWEAFYTIEEAGVVLTSNDVALSVADEGDGILVNVYLEPTGNSVHVTVTSPSSTTLVNNIYPVNGPTYTDAQALADWTTATTQPAPVLTAPNPKTRDTQFLQGRFTTANGVGGTFNGPWTLHAVDATSNGTPPPTGTVIAQPSYLWTDGNSFNGLWGDAFGVWRFPF